MTPENDSGSIEVAGDQLRYRAHLCEWTLPVSRILLIAEYTTSDGPYFDDYFLVFLTPEKDVWFEASFYAQGRDEALRLLEKQLGCPLSLELYNSATFNTRIVWPESAKNQRLLERLPAPKRTWWRRLTSVELHPTVMSSAAQTVLGWE